MVLNGTNNLENSFLATSGFVVVNEIITYQTEMRCVESFNPLNFHMSDRSFQIYRKGKKCTNEDNKKQAFHDRYPWVYSECGISILNRMSYG